MHDTSVDLVSDNIYPWFYSNNQLAPAQPPGLAQGPSESRRTQSQTKGFGRHLCRMWPAASTGRDLPNYGPHASVDPGREPHMRARSGLTQSTWPPSSSNSSPIAHPVKAWLTGICWGSRTTALIVIGANCTVVIAAVWRLMRSAITHGFVIKWGDSAIWNCQKGKKNRWCYWGSW